MPNIEWDAPMTIVSPYLPAGLPINTPFTGPGSGQKEWLFQIIDPTTYKIVPEKFRPVIDSLSQADGMSIQPPFIDGLIASFEIGYWVQLLGDEQTRRPACDAELWQMDELLMGVLNSLRAYPTDVSTQQYLWLPTGLATQKLLDGVMLGSWPTPDFKNSPEVRKVFDLVCPYPYALTDAPHTNPPGSPGTPLAPGASMVVANNGNSPGLPILFAIGLGHDFIVTNTTTGQSIAYDSTLPGALPIPAGHTLQIDFHEGSVLLDGNPLLDYIAGLKPSTSEFFALAPGNNTITSDPSGDTNVYMVSYDYWV